MKPRDMPAKYALCQGPHTANYIACPKSPYAKKREVPVQSPTTAKVTTMKLMQRLAQCKPDVAKVTANPAKKAPEAMETDTSQPSRGKTPPAASGPKFSPKKPVKFQPPTKAPVVVEEVDDYDASEATKIDVISTLSQLIPFIQKINWSKLLEVAASLLPKLLKCISRLEAPLLLTSHLQDVLVIFTSNE
ncbi:hypothetical protein Trydic_g11625 [Trypoxylus dichotomus]